MDFRQIIRDTKNEELVQIREREARKDNIIIHGFLEASEGPVGNNEDIQTIKELLNVIEVKAMPVSTTRIGEQNDAKPRPIKIKMRNLNEKEMVISNLGKLKHAPEKFRRTSLTDDHTAGQREAIKSKVSEARNKTEAEGEGKYIRKVCGSSQVREYQARRSSNIGNNENKVSNVVINGPCQIIMLQKEIKKLSCLYSNVDQLLNKMDELRMLIASNEPDIMMFTEVIPKAQKTPITSKINGLRHLH